MFKLKRLKYSLLSLALAFPGIAFAAASQIINSNDNPGGILPTGIFGHQATIGGTILGIIQILLGIVGLISVAMIIYGGFRYTTAGGNDEVTKSAKKTIINAIIGLVIVILSYVIVTIVTNLAFGTVG
ncbi:MAG TPA: hypothetical protein VFX17_02960 [Patescibacteria group bacterium]|nr:hypothetical protein [Patescibacteria group bacterium]